MIRIQFHVLMHSNERRVPFPNLHSGERLKGAKERTPELHFLVGLHVGSRNTQHPPRRMLDRKSSTGRDATPGGVTRRCHPGGSTPGESGLTTSLSVVNSRMARL